MRVFHHCSVVHVALGTMLFALCSPAQAQQPTKHFRIGYLSPSGSSFVEVFRESLSRLGYVEGQNILAEYRWAEGNADRLPVLAADLGRLRADVIVTQGTQATLAAKQATNTIPIVVGGAGDLVVDGLVASLARPGGNVTGSTNIASDLSAKRLELLKESLPSFPAWLSFTMEVQEEIKAN